MKNKDLKFAFFGTPDVASETLQTLIDNDFIPKLVITNTDKPSGRGMTMHESPVKKVALQNNLKIIERDSIQEDLAEIIKDFDISIVVAYGSIMPENVINTPKYGTLNIHYSLLPKHRGASPVESALLAGDTETGVTIQKMVKKLDAGAIIATEKININMSDTKEQLRNSLIKMGANLLIETLPKYLNDEINPITQNESESTHCKKIKKEEGLIDPNGDATENYNKYRAYYGWPGIYFFKDGKRIKITSARLEDGKFIIEKVIPEGKKETIWK